MSALALQVDAGQAQHRLVDHAEVGFDRWLRRASRARARPDRSRRSARARLPGNPCPGRRCRSSRCGVRSMRTGVASRRMGKSDRRLRASAARGGCATDESAGMAGAEHPLIAAHRAHAAAHLVGERLEAERAVTGGQRAGNGGAWPGGSLRGEEDIDRFFEAALQQVSVAREGN